MLCSEVPQLQIKSVLLVEDDEVSSTILSKIFDIFGWETTVASTLHQAKIFLARQTPRCVVVDIMLPDGHGGMLLEEIRRRNIKTKIIVTSGANDPDKINLVMRHRPDLFMRKPIDSQALLRAMDEE